MGAAGREGRTKRTTDRQSKPRTRSGLNEGRRDLAERGPACHPPTERRDSGPNELKLSDRGWPRKTRNTQKAPPPASVRWSAWLGCPPTEGLWMAQTDGMDSGGGMRALPPGRQERSGERAERRDGPTERPERGPTGAGSNSEQARRWQQREREPARPRRTHWQEVAGLTNSSSATGHGYARLDTEKRRAAMACSLERVVRLPAYRGASGTPEGQATTPAGE